MILYKVLGFVLRLFRQEIETTELSEQAAVNIILDDIEQQKLIPVNSNFALCYMPDIEFNELIEELRLAEDKIRLGDVIPYLKCLHVEKTTWYWHEFFNQGGWSNKPAKIKIALLTRARVLLELYTKAEELGSSYTEYYYARVMKLIALCIDMLEELHYE